MKKRVAWVLFVVVLFCLANGSSSAAIFDVTIRDFEFVPPTLPINVGDTVRWTNNGPSTHTVTSGSNCNSDGMWGSGFLSPGETFSLAFMDPGTFPYFCAFAAHCSSTGMTGTITVSAPSSLPVPVGLQVFDRRQTPTSSPLLSADPAQAIPFGFGAVVTGGNSFRIEAGLSQTSGPVDVYLAILAPSISSGIFLLTPTGLQTFAGVLVPWMTNVAVPINLTLLPDTSTSLLLTGDYIFALVVTPPGTGNLDNSYIWITGFTI